MAQLAVSLAGAAIGSFFGPLGAQIGWAAGSLLGASLFGEGQKGPRLQDLKVQVSTYGAPLPLPYGGVQLAGNVIWSTDLLESQSESGGKGGPTVTSFSYSVSCAVAFSDRQIGGIRRIWADAMLVYDAREDADSATQVSSAAFAEYMTVYLGTESQTPDPTIEAVEGAGNVEAYRGVAYVVFTGLPLADYGNRIPSFRFEVTTEEPVEIELTALEPLRVYPWTATGRPVHSFGDTQYTSPYSPYNTGTTFQSIAEQNSANHNTGGYFGSGLSDGCWEWMNLYRKSQTTPLFNIDIDVLGVDPEYVWYALGIEPEGTWQLDARTVTFGDFDSSLLLIKEIPSLQLYVNQWPVVTRRTEGLQSAGTPETEYPFYGNSTSYVIDEDCTYDTCILSVAWYYPLLDLSAKRVPTHAGRSCYSGNPCTNAEGAAELPGNEDFCLTCDGEVTPNYTWTIVTGTAKTLCDVEYRAGVLYQNALGPVLLPADPDYSNAAFWSAARTAAIAAGAMQSDVTYPVIVSSYASGVAPPTASVEAGSALLSDIVEDICVRSGLETTDINVEQLVDEVQGFIVSRQMPGRSAIEPLRQAFYFDAVENGDQIIFVKRGAASVETITSDYLGTSESGEPTALIVPKRAQETELPAQVSVAYMVRAADYQTGVQQANRYTTGSRQVVSLELPIVMTDDYAAQVADVLMVEAWQGRVERKFSTSRRFTNLLPTDVITVDDGQFEYRGRLTDKSEDGPLIRWALRDDATATYSPSVTSSPTSGGGGVVRFVGPMSVELMDIPGLRDDDDDAGFYAGAGTYIGTFRGGVLYKSTDDVTYNSLQELRVAATIGQATSALGDFAGGNIFDETNSVTILLHSGSLASASMAQVLDGSNAVMLGDEILQFRTATLVAENTYTLTGLLRGRRGTEWAISGHAVSDRFVLLNESTIYRVTQSLAQIGLGYYRPVSYGQSVSEAGTIEFTNTATALKPLSPVHLNVTQDGGDLVVTWVRRTRIGGAWADGIDAPLSEASESYRVRLLGGAGDVIEEQTVSVQTATLTLTSDSYSIEVVQLSATVGAGFPITLIL